MCPSSRRFLALFALVFVTLGAWGDPLDRVADELDSIAADLSTAQAQTQALRDRLAGLQSLSEEHQATLKAQAELQAQYDQAVADLEAHDRASLALAEDLKAQLDAERTLVAWAVPAGVAVLGVALVEGWLLVHR